VYTPSNYLTDGSRKSPLLLFLHGLGESGNGNFELLKKHGPPRLSSTLDRFGFVIVSPQHALPVSMEDVPTAWRPDVLMSLVEQVCEKMSIDRDRIYVTGLSMGGFGTWRLVATHPDRFAAAIPICGGGEIEWADRLNTVPIWAFHGAKDSVVPLARSKEMVDAVQAMGGDVKLRIYPEAAHDSWTKTYDNPEIYEWMLRHSRKE
jgi:predicted peptidase